MKSFNHFQKAAKKKKNVIIQVEPFNKDTWHLTWIHREGEKGSGSKVLQALGKRADRNKKKIILQEQGKKLIYYYRTLGFHKTREKTDDGHIMIRQPKKLKENVMISFREFLELLTENEGRINFIKKQHPVIKFDHDNGMFTHLAGKIGGHEVQNVWRKHVGNPTDVDITPERISELEKKASHHIIDHIAHNIDPTPQKKYTDWLVRQYKKKTFRFEDSPHVKRDMENFNTYKNHLAEKDINQYNHIADVSDAVRPYVSTGAAPSKSKELERIKKEGTKVLYDKGGLQVHQLLTKEAACALHGHDTRWCTSAREHNAFESYHSMGPLFVIQTPDKQKYQIHHESGQYMDAGDRMIDPHVLTSLHPELKTIPELKPKIGKIKAAMPVWQYQRQRLTREHMAFLNPSDLKPHFDNWSKHLEFIGDREKEMLVKHGEERHHQAILNHYGLDSAADLKDEIAHVTKSKKILKQLAGERFHPVHLVAEYRLEKEFGHVTKTSHENLPKEKKVYGSHEWVGSPAHLRHLTKLARYVDERQNTHKDPHFSKWLKTKLSRLNDEYKQHWPKIHAFAGDITDPDKIDRASWVAHNHEEYKKIHHS